MSKNFKDNFPAGSSFASSESSLDLDNVNKEGEIVVSELV